MRRLPTAAALLAVLLLAGCGSDGEDSTSPPATTDAASDGGGAATQGAPAGARARDCGGPLALRTVGASCESARAVVAAWQRAPGCRRGKGRSRFACSVRGFRCLGIRAQHGLAITCARPGRSLSFVAEPGS